MGKILFAEMEQLQDALNEVLYPARAISQQQHLKGRSGELESLKKALIAPGRQPFVYGLRGAGKTSLALSGANDFSESESALVHCQPGMSFGDVIRNLVSATLGHDPLETERSVETDGNVQLDLKIVKGGGGIVETRGYHGIPTPADANEAAALIRAVLSKRTKRFCFIVDEFDQLTDANAHQAFGFLVKLLADTNVAAKFVFCGVADDVQQIFKAHPSTFRYFEPIEVSRLALQPCLDIVDDVEKAIGVEIDRNTKIRIAQISDGFPYFVHLITEKTMWRWFADTDKQGFTTPDHYEAGLRDAAASAAPELKVGYDLAANKYALDGEMIVWALATGDLLEKQIKVVHKHFCEVFDVTPGSDKPQKCLNQNQLSARLNHFMKEPYGKMVASPRRSFYAFTEKRMRGYARLRAAMRGVPLRPDHPLATY